MIDGYDEGKILKRSVSKTGDKPHWLLLTSNWSYWHVDFFFTAKHHTRPLRKNCKKGMPLYGKKSWHWELREIKWKGREKEEHDNNKSIERCNFSVIFPVLYPAFPLFICSLSNLFSLQFYSTCRHAIFLPFHLDKKKQFHCSPPPPWFSFFPWVTRASSSDEGLSVHDEESILRFINFPIWEKFQFFALVRARGRNIYALVHTRSDDHHFFFLQ